MDEEHMHDEEKGFLSPWNGFHFKRINGYENEPGPIRSLFTFLWFFAGINSKKQAIV